MQGLAFMVDLDRIPWKRLRHAYGSAEDVPGFDYARFGLLHQMGRVKNLHCILCTHSILHQGTIYEATAYAVPFLIDLAVDTRTPDRRGILGLLADIATGWAERYDRANYRHEREFEARERSALDAVIKAHEAVASGFDALSEMTKENSEVGLAAARVSGPAAGTFRSGGIHLAWIVEK